MGHAFTPRFVGEVRLGSICNAHLALLGNLKGILTVPTKFYFSDELMFKAYKLNS